jgi:hypothetical protein
MTLTSTWPRSIPRTTHTPHPPSISYPVHPQSTIIPPVSPPSTPPHSRRPSISNPMPWLSRTSTQSSIPYAPSKPTRISEPKLVRSIELVSQQRSGILGTGATIVRTPDEALRETGVRLTFDGKGKDAEKLPSRKSGESRRSRSSEGRTREKRPSLDEYPHSPPLPPLPMPEDEELELLEPEPVVEPPKAPPRPNRTPPAPSLRSSLKAKSTAPSDESSQVPPLPANISASPVPPPFRPILVSDVPTGAVDPSKIIVTLDTCTATYRTALDTLRSRPSHLSGYLSSLCLASERASVSSSVYSTSTASDDMSVYRHHLASQGLLSQASFSIHLFLDRPSAPYVWLTNPHPTPSLTDTSQICTYTKLSQITRRFTRRTRGPSSERTASVFVPLTAGTPPRAPRRSSLFATRRPTQTVYRRDQAPPPRRAPSSHSGPQQHERRQLHPQSACICL